MSIDDKVEGQTIKKSTTAKCYYNNTYQYRTKGDDDKNYCCLSDPTCLYYKGVNGQDLCLAYNPRDDVK